MLGLCTKVIGESIVDISFLWLKMGKVTDYAELVSRITDA